MLSAIQGYTLIAVFFMDFSLQLENSWQSCPSVLAQQNETNELMCLQSGTCETEVTPPLPLRVTETYCPTSKVYCLDYAGCMIPDPVFIPSSRTIAIKCPVQLKLCLNTKTCQFYHLHQTKDYDDLLADNVSANDLKCSLVANETFLEPSECTLHSQCHWTSRCCQDQGLYRKCVSYNGTVINSNSRNVTGGWETVSYTKTMIVLNCITAMTLLLVLLILLHRQLKKQRISHFNNPSRSVSFFVMGVHRRSGRFPAHDLIQPDYESQNI